MRNGRGGIGNGRVMLSLGAAVAGAVNAGFNAEAFAAEFG